MATTVMWFRRDLRLEDNLALAAAAADGPVLALFVLDPAFDRAGAPRQAFLSGSLAALDGALDGKLVCRAGDPAEVVPTVAAEVEAGVGGGGEDFGPHGRRRGPARAAWWGRRTSAPPAGAGTRQWRRRCGPLAGRCSSRGRPMPSLLARSARRT